MIERIRSSEYMHWAKTQSFAEYNLASSGLANFPLAKFPVRLDDLEITGNSFYGYEPLQQAIAAKQGVDVGRIFSTVGTSLANHIAMATLLNVGDEVLIEQPTYELLISTARYIGATVKRFSRSFEDGFRIDPQTIEKAISPRTKLIIITNLHNPTSVYTDEKTLKAVGEIARSVGAYVLVDEVYLDAAFTLSPRSAIHLGKEFIVTNSLTKVYGLSGLRCGWVAGDPDFITKMWRLNDLFDVIPPHPSERMSVIAFHHLHMLAEHARTTLELNQRLVTSFLSSRKDLQCVTPGFGTVVFPKLIRGDVNRLCSLLREKYQTSVTPGHFFEMPQHFRIGLGGNSEILAAGLTHIGKALDEMNG